jgi:thiamine pyrophosphate-dependent acetolactate synthase large subunit-like protein
MDPVIAALARAAGLDKALAAFPDDVRAAAEQALNNTGVVNVPANPAAEPWPPMRPGIGLLAPGATGPGQPGHDLPGAGE